MNVTPISAWLDSPEALKPRVKRKDDPVIIAKGFTLIVKNAPGGDFILCGWMRDWQGLWLHCQKAERATGNVRWSEVLTAIAHYGDSHEGES